MIVACWSGPRNISTAFMRAWENRSDTFVVDEPLYAHYLKETKLQREMADEIINHYEDNWEKVIDWLTGPIPEEKTIFYQKHMCHHMLPNIRFEWLSNVTNCFLIREPNERLGAKNGAKDIKNHPWLSNFAWSKLERH